MLPPDSALACVLKGVGWGKSKEGEGPRSQNSKSKP